MVSRRGGENSPPAITRLDSSGGLFLQPLQVVQILATPPQGELPVSILLNQSFRLAVGKKAWEIELIIRVGVESADEAFWVNLLEVGNGQEGLVIPCSGGTLR